MPRRVTIRAWVAALTLAAVTATLGSAQEREPFSWVRVTAGAAHLTPRLPSGDYWRTGHGPAIRVETPLVPGVFAVGAQRHLAEAGSDVSVPAADELSLWLVFAGWGDEARVGRLALGGEIRLGMVSTSAPEPLPNRVERELLYGAAGWLRADIGAGWSLRGEAAAHRVSSNHRWNPMAVSLGLGRTFGIRPRLRGIMADSGPVADDVEGAVELASEPTWWRSFADVPARAFGLEGTGTDRYDQLWSPGYLRPPESGTPRIWLDGFPISGATLGGPPWAWLPLGTGDIASIDVLARPGVLERRPELEGALRVTTKGPDPHRRVRAQVTILNESGDPGPLRFTPLTSPNVDGPLYEADTGAGHVWDSGQLSISAVRRERWSLTQPGFAARNPTFDRGSAARVRTDGVSVGATQRFGETTVRGRFWTSSGERFLRAPALANEISADVDYTGVGLSAAIPVRGPDSLHVYLVGSGWGARSPNLDRPAPDPRILDWSESVFDLGAEYRLPVRGFDVSAGAEVTRRIDELTGTSTERGFGRNYVAVSRDWTGWRAEVGGELGGGGAASSVFGRVDRAVGRARLGAELSWTTGGVGGPFELWNRAVEDVGVLTALGLPGLSVTEEHDRGDRFTSRFTTGIAADRWAGELGVFVHRFWGQRRPRIEYLTVGPLVSGRWGPLEPGAGHLVGVSLEVSGGGEGPLTGGLTVEAVRLSGSDAFLSWWSATPSVTARAHAAVRLRPGWRLLVEGRGRPSVDWEVAGIPDGRIPGALLGDIHLEGRVLGGRLRFVIGTTNVFDADARTHPLGADEARGFVVGVGTAL